MATGPFLFAIVGKNDNPIYECELVPSGKVLHALCAVQSLGAVLQLH